MDVRRAGIALAMGLGLLALGGTPASADSLYTTPAHTALVTTGSTAHLISGTTTLSGTFGSTPATDVCTSSTLAVQISQNDPTVVVATVTSGTFSGCSTGIPTGNFPWRMTVRGAAITSGSDKVYLNTTWDNVSISAFATFTGTFIDASGAPPANGAYAKQPAAAAAPVCFALANAGTLTAGSGNTMTLNGTYCPTGGAATSWSLAGPPAVLRTDPADTIVPSGATLSNGAGTTAFTIFSTGLSNCEATWGITVGASGGPVITGAIDSLTMTSCSNTWLTGITVNSCARFAVGTSPITLSTTGTFLGDWTATNLYLRCSLAGTSTRCYYNVPSAKGMVVPPGPSSLVGHLTHQVPAGVTDDTGFACGSAAGTFSGTLNDLTTGGTTVTLHQS